MHWGACLEIVCIHFRKYCFLNWLLKGKYVHRCWKRKLFCICLCCSFFFFLSNFSGLWKQIDVFILVSISVSLCTGSAQMRSVKTDQFQGMGGRWRSIQWSWQQTFWKAEFSLRLSWPFTFSCFFPFLFLGHKHSCFHTPMECFCSLVMAVPCLFWGLVRHSLLVTSMEQSILPAAFLVSENFPSFTSCASHLGSGWAVSFFSFPH